MPQRYQHSSDGEGGASCLDELLCEYVDGTMDATVARAFEEVLRRDAGLAQQVEHLRTTRHLLCRHGDHLQAPQGLETRVRRRLACEMMRTHGPAFSTALERLGTATLAASAMGVMLMLGVLVGLTLSPGATPGASLQAATTWPALRAEPAPLDVPRAPMTPLPRHERPLRQPWFAGAPPLPPARASYLLTPASAASPALQRTGGVP